MNHRSGRSGAACRTYLGLYEDAIARNEQATRALFAEGVIADVLAVADEALQIVDLPHGSRPYRSEVGFSDLGDAPVNAVAAFMRERLKLPVLLTWRGNCHLVRRLPDRVPTAVPAGRD